MKRHASINRAYRLVWNQVLDAWVAVAENARGRGKGSCRELVAVALSIATTHALASPSGGQVTAGSGSIAQSGATTTITQTSQNLSLRWDSFNTVAGETVNFVQPSASAIAVNRIFDPNGTKFFGNLNANGQVYLINPNGIIFGATAQVNVGGLVASTLDLNDADLANASRSFSGTGTGSVVNQGTLNGRYVALIGNTVRNQGTITTPNGMTALGAGSAVTLTFADTSLVKMQVDQSTLDNLAENGGLIRADGGMALLTAGAKNALLASVVNNTGVIEARSVQNVNGAIVLDGGKLGTVTNSGTLDASGKNAGETGGTVKVLGQQVDVQTGTNIDVSGDGGGGTALIGGNFHGAGPEQNATTTNVATGASINVAAIASGDGGNIAVWSDGHTTVDATLSARGGANGGNGGQVETSGKELTIGDNTRVNTLALRGMAGNWLLDPNDFTIAAVSGDITGAVLTNALQLGSVTIQTTSGAASCSGAMCTTGTPGSGDIIIDDFIGGAPGAVTPAGWTAATTLTLSAYRNITFKPIASGGSGSAGIDSSNANGASVVFRADNTGTGTGTVIYNTIDYTGAVALCAGGGCTGTFSIYYNPSSYSSPTDFSPLVLQGTLNPYMLVHLNNTSATAQNKTYDGGTGASLDTPFTLLTTTAAGTPTGATLNAGTAAFADKNAGNNKAVTFSSYSVSGSNAGQSYFLAAQPISQTANINQKTLTITGATVNNKTYDTTTTATLAAIGTLSGFIGTETVTVSGGTGTFANKNVGNGKAVTVTGVTLADGANGGLASNYSVTNPVGLTANITPASLTVTGVTANNKTYDATTAATLGGTATVAALGGDMVSVGGTGSGTFADKNVGNGKAVAVTGYTLSGADAGNYTIVQPVGVTANITAANLAVTGVTASNKVYDGTTAATLGGTATVAALGSDVVSVGGAGSGAFADKNVGTGKAVTITGYTLSGADAGNYTIVQPTGVTANITAKAVTVSGITASNKTYDGGTTATVNTAGAVFTGKIGGDTLSVTAATGTFADKNVGTGKTVTLSGTTYGGADAGNYTFTDQATASANITAKAVTVSGITASNKTYDGGTTATVNTAGAVFTGKIGGDTLSVTAATGTFADKNVGTGKTVTLSGTTYGGADAGNYTFTDQATATANITAKALTLGGITASNKVYDGTTSATLNTAGVTFTGLIGGDTVTLGGAGAGTFADKNVGSGKTITVSGYTLGGADAGNYSVGQPSGLTANITPAALSVSGITASNKTYDGSTSATVNTAGAVLTGKIGGDTVTVSATGAFADKNVGVGKTITLSSSYGGADAGNYTFTDQTSTTANITAKAVTLTAPSVTKTYDGGTGYTATAGNLTTLSGSLVGGDTVTAATIAYADKNVGTNKTVNLNSVTISDGNGGNNYSVTLAGNSTSTINQANLTVTANNASKTYDGAAYSGGNGVSYSGFVGGETSAVLGGTLAYGGTSQGAVNTGTYTISPSGLTSSNYALSFVNGALTINSSTPPAPPAPPVPPSVIPQVPLPPPVSLSPVLTVQNIAPAPGGTTGGGGMSGNGGALGNGGKSDNGSGTSSDGGRGPVAANTVLNIGGMGPTLFIMNGGMKLPDNVVSTN
jgi:filamentous hemagglutinin family protein